jgi:hypothetical protein
MGWDWSIHSIALGSFWLMAALTFGGLYLLWQIHDLLVAILVELRKDRNTRK